MKMKELLTDESKWTKGHYAKDKEGNKVQDYHQDACQWCLLGAMFKCYGQSETDHPLIKIYNYINSTGNHITTPEWNDHPDRTFQHIKKLVEELDI